MTYEEQQKLRHRVRQLEGTAEWLQAKLDRANSILSEHKLGMYKYTTTPEEKWQHKIDLACSRIRFDGEQAAKRIRMAFGEHEAYQHKMYKYATMRREKKKWSITIYHHSDNITNAGPFKTKKAAKAYLEETWTEWLTGGILFEQLKKEQEDKNDKNIRTRKGTTSI